MNDTIFFSLMGLLGSICLLMIGLWIIGWKQYKYYEDLQRKYANGELNANS